MNWIIAPIVALPLIIGGYWMAAAPSVTNPNATYVVKRANNSCSTYKNGTWSFGECK